MNETPAATPRVHAGCGHLALARAACDAELVRLGWTLDVPPASLWEEDRRRDAVVDAALAWEAYGHGDDMSEAAAADLCNAVNALTAHRAKKGGA